MSVDLVDGFLAVLLQDATVVLQNIFRLIILSLSSRTVTRDLSS